MERLFQFLYRYRALILFLFLEYLAFILIKNRTIYQQTRIVQAGNEISGRINTQTSGFIEYLNLKRHNRELRDENAKLRDLLARRKDAPTQGYRTDRPPEVLQQYYFVPARVINNSTNRFNNYITINKGALHGIEPDMGVITSNGIVGKVESVSTNFSTVISVLHTGYYVAAKIIPDEIQCTIKWDAESSNLSRVLYVPRHLKIIKGDTLVTSGFNAIFPSDIPVGVLSEVGLTESATFYDLKVKLFTNFNALKNVYVVGNRLRDERLNVEASLEPENGD
jgi:rod shape-determining protein MreC